MGSDRAEAVWLTEEHEFSLPELAVLSGLTEAELRELVDYGAVTPVNPDSPAWAFSATSLATVRMACRLRVSFDLELNGVALMVSLLNRIHELEEKLGNLRAQLPPQTR